MCEHGQNILESVVYIYISLYKMALGYLIIFLQYGRVSSTKNTGLSLSGVFEVVYYKVVVYLT